MSAVIVDNNVLLDILAEDGRWLSWSSNALERIGNESRIVINPVIYGEVSIRFERIEELDEVLPSGIFERRRAGAKSSLPPDFYVGAHAAIRSYRVLTRDVARYRAHFPKLELIAP